MENFWIQNTFSLDFQNISPVLQINSSVSQKMIIGLLLSKRNLDIRIYVPQKFLAKFGFHSCVIVRIVLEDGGIDFNFQQHGNGKKQNTVQIYTSKLHLKTQWDFFDAPLGKQRKLQATIYHKLLLIKEDSSK